MSTPIYNVIAGASDLRSHTRESLLFRFAGARFIASALDCWGIPSLWCCLLMIIDIVGALTDVETIARGLSVRDRKRLRKQFGGSRWRKLKGIAKVRLANGRIRLAELHWYEAHGIGKKKLKIKRVLDLKMKQRTSIETGQG